MGSNTVKLAVVFGVHIFALIYNDKAFNPISVMVVPKLPTKLVVKILTETSKPDLRRFALATF